MARLYTIGFTRKSLREFVSLLQEAGVDAVVDIRLRPHSQLAGYAHGRDLAYVLELVGIGYEHQPLLAPTDEILDGYRKGGTWERYVSSFTELMHARSMAEIGRSVLARWKAPCLLCSEATAEQCHRRLVAEYWAHRLPALEIVHL